MLDLAIINGTAITLDRERRVLKGGAVGISDGAIAVVSPTAEGLGDAREVIDASGHIILPGIVDSHGHAGHSLTRGLGEGLDDGGWMHTVETIYFKASDTNFWEAESRLAAYERLRFGVTTSVSMTGSSPRVDSPRYALAAATGYRELGLRHIVAAGPPQGPWPRRYTSRDGADAGTESVVDLDHALRVTEELIQAFRDMGNPLVQFYVGPSAISPSENPDDTFTRDQVIGVAALVRKYNANLHTHAYAGQIAAAHKIDPEFLGPHVLMAHCAGISMEEIAIMAKAGASATTGPLTHAYVSARFPVIEALDAGVNVVFSTDGSAPDRSFDLIDQARIGVQLQRVHFNDSRILPIGKALEMITIDAAKALGMDDQIGSLDIGKRADMILIDARQAHLAPEILAPARVIGHATGHDVRTVIVDGNVLMRNNVIDADLNAIIADGTNALMAAWERAGFGDINKQHPNTWRSVRYSEAPA
jgi:cytosine/adenosine deaminase-related metal-dependent hydrolase